MFEDVTCKGKSQVSKVISDLTWEGLIQFIPENLTVSFILPVSS